MGSPSIAAAFLLGTFALVLGASCGKEGSEAPDATPSDETPSELGAYDPGSELVVPGRERLRVCVEVLAGVVPPGEAAMAIESALRHAAGEPAWPREFGRPAVDETCPLEPVALDPSQPFTRRWVCVEVASPYLVFVFIASQADLEERFPGDTVVEAEGVRKATQERLLSPAGECLDDVSEAWYLLPDELDDPPLLERFIYGPNGIFSIADFRR